MILKEFSLAEEILTSALGLVKKIGGMKKLKSDPRLPELK
jgi:hypothetical protein